MRPHFACPVQATANAITGKWKVQIIWHLAYRPRRFGEMRRLLPNVSEKVLTAQLRELEVDLILRREVLEAQPPQVTYSLTPAGEELLRGLQLLCEWGTKYLGIAPRLPPLPGEISSVSSVSVTHASNGDGEGHTGARVRSADCQREIGELSEVCVSRVDAQQC